LTTDIDIIGLQRRMRQLGEIRIGHTVDTGKVSQKTGKPILRPAKLDQFRLTSASRPTLEEVAKLYGGTVQPWTPANGGPSEWEVYTGTDRLPVIIPPRNAVTQCYEMYKGSKCVRRCNGRIEEKSDRACMCDPDERDCALTTRLNVMLRDVPGLGVWLLTSHGYYAAVELPPVAEFLASTNGYVDAWLTMELKRVPRDDGPMAEFMVPKLDIAVTPAQLLAGHGAITPQAIDAGQQRAAATGQVVPAAVEGARPAIAAAAEPATENIPRDDDRDAAYIQRAIECRTADQVREIYSEVVAAGHMHKLLADQLTTIGRTKAQRPEQPAQSADDTRANLIKGVAACRTLDELTAALTQVQMAGFAQNLDDESDELAQAFVARREALAFFGEAKPDTPAPVGPDPEALWSQIVSEAGGRGFDRTDDVEMAFAARWNGDAPATASPTQLQTFLDELRAGKVRPPKAATAASSTGDDKPPF
jgi:recombination directionality factor gp3-like protein